MFTKTVLSDIRLGDGVPISLEMNIRWKITDRAEFYEQFRSIGQYDTLVLFPRAKELAAKIANSYDSVDSVFTVHHEAFINDIKAHFTEQLGEGGIAMKEVIVSEVIFPPTFTDAMEQVGLRERELEQIRLKNNVDLEKAKALEKKAEADGEVAIQEAKTEGQVAKINAETEQKRRMSKLAEAETDRQVIELKAKAEANKKRLLAKADLEEKTDLKNLEVEKQREMYHIEMDRERTLADNISRAPAFATYLVGKELANSVQVAFVPIGTEGTVFSDLLQNMSSPHQATTLKVDMNPQLEEGETVIDVGNE